jgi:hypothetical protein
MTNTKNFEGQVLSKALDVFQESSPEEASRTFEELVNDGWDQVRARLFIYTATRTERAIIIGDLFMKLAPLMMKQGSK